MSERKHARHSVEVKDAGKGTVSCVFSTLEPVIDSDNDVTRKGAFGVQDVVISAYGHKSWEGLLPVGRGRIYEHGNEAVMEGRFFLDTAAGRETFHVVKELGTLGQWSYGFDVVRFSNGTQDGRTVRFLEQLKVHEVSPVLVGAGVGTRTLTAKSANLDAELRAIARANGIPVAMNRTETRAWAEAIARKWDLL